MPKKVASESTGKTVKSKAKKKDFLIVGIGTSTGRIEALEHFVVDSTHTSNMTAFLNTTSPQSATGEYYLMSAAFMTKQVGLNRYF